MGQQKRGRGRPPGSGMKDDLPILERVADMLATEPALKATTAFKRLGTKNPSHVRRLQVKWRAFGADLLMTARARKEERANALRSIPKRAQVPDTRGRATASGGDLAGYGLFGNSALGSPESQAIQRAIAEQQQIERMLKPYGESVAMQQLREHEKMMEAVMGPQRQHEKMMEDLMRPQRQHEKMMEDLMRPQRQHEKMMEDLMRPQREHEKMMEAIMGPQRQYEKMMKDLMGPQDPLRGW